MSTGDGVRTLHLQWLERAARAGESGELEAWMSTELDTLAWRATIAAVSRRARLHEAQRALEVGFGWGRVVVGIKRAHPQLELDGVELAPEFVQAARDLIEDLGLSGVHLEQGDVYALEPSDKLYDAVYATRVLHYLDDKVDALDRMRRVLRPGGRVVVIVPNRWCPAQWGRYEHGLYSPRRLARDLRDAGFIGVRMHSARFFPDGVSARLPASTPLRHAESALGRLPPSRWIGALAVLSGRRP